MVAHDEEHDGLLDEFELQDEDTKTQSNSSHRTVRRCARLVRRRIWCLITVAVTIALLCTFGAASSIIGTLRAPKGPEKGGRLGIRLHPEEHATRPPTTITFNWTITAGRRSPDGVEKRVYLVNDEFPGPTIEARSGDRLVLHIHNELETEGVSLHWHGLRMRNQNLMDGAVGITQCPIPPGRDYVYNFTIGDDEHGTFWWHSHSDVQRADGLWGGLIVHSPQDARPSPGEYLVMVSDWFHRNQTEVLAWYADASSRGNEPVPDSLLVNGRGRFNCSMAVPARPVVCSQIAAYELAPLFNPSREKATRLRFVNTGSVAGFSVQMNGATMQPVRIDGGFSVQAEASDSIGILYPGERVDVDVKWMEENPRNHWLTIDLDSENFGYPNPSLNPTQSFRIFKGKGDEDDHKGYQARSETRDLDLQNLTAATQVSEIPSKAKETFVFYAKTEKLSHLNYEPVGFINHTSWKPQSPPLLSQNRSTWDENQLVPFIGLALDEPTRVDIVINNLDDGAHPFHLHGHFFYVLSSYRNEGRGGWGSFNPFSSGQPPNGLNLDSPLRKDTVSVPRRGHVVLTLVADNPGIWMLHCHMLVHMARGMAMAFHVGDVEDVEHVTSAYLRTDDLCGRDTI
ncbi:hypothetical protein LCI18_010772 [Fusarium solani-melongenae]|uniref:Uncharacterized protein n=1 Tax=Fusarium solani subsp. cucurbitae TaxID=2747967 RepID=A0ACD3ZFT6_FUSSC|nr:hypothetical protein LCI18_010772 [Fusarium solani-melongenae]